MGAHQSIVAALTSTTGASAGTAQAIRGKPASRGRWVGPARLVHPELSPESLRTGEVLICQRPQPGLASLLARAGAIVLESGGALSSPATRARELGIPAVVAAVDATARIRDGQLVAVDGDRGTVRVIPSS